METIFILTFLLLVVIMGLAHFRFCRRLCEEVLNKVMSHDSRDEEGGDNWTDTVIELEDFINRKDMTKRTPQKKTINTKQILINTGIQNQKKRVTKRRRK